MDFIHSKTEELFESHGPEAGQEDEEPEAVCQIFLLRPMRYVRIFGLASTMPRETDRFRCLVIAPPPCQPIC